MYNDKIELYTTKDLLKIQVLAPVTPFSVNGSE